MNTVARQASQFSLFRQRRFLPFFLTQFLGAFNDNVFKNALIILIAFSTTLEPDSINKLTNLSAGLFILPFFFFSAVAGQLIDKYEKSNCIRWIKLAEIVIMLSAAAAFYFNLIFVLIGILFTMGMQSTFFGPAKYSYIPQHLTEDELIAGNALVQSGTFIAILVGTMTGGILISLSGGVFWLSAILMITAFFGYAASLYIPITPSQDSNLIVNWNPFTQTWKNIQRLAQNKSIFVLILAISWFWFFGVTYLVQLPNYTKTVLGGNEQVVTLLLCVFTISVGVGGLLCMRFSKGGINQGLIPVGLIGLTVFGIDMFFAQPETVSAQLINAQSFIEQTSNLRVLLDIALIGIFAGLYIVPLFALVQSKSDKAQLSRVIAGNNIFNALFMVVASVLAIVLFDAGITIAEFLLLTSLLNILVILILYWHDPTFFNLIHRFISKM